MKRRNTYERTIGVPLHHPSLFDDQEVTVTGYEGPHYLPAIGARPRPAFGVVSLLIMTARRLPGFLIG